MHRFVIPLFAVAFAGCGIPNVSSGGCRGEVNGVSAEGGLDGESSYFQDATSGETVFNLSCGGGRFAVSLRTSKVGDGAAFNEYELLLPSDCTGSTSPAPASDAETALVLADCRPSRVHAFRFAEPARHARLTRASLQAERRLDTPMGAPLEPIDGSLHIMLEDGSWLSIEFGVRHDSERDVGSAR